jgi:ABC-type branched-subunit amino acid transport system substrate-binding protein
MKKHTYKVGVLLSITGPYSLPVRAMADGIRVALEEINGNPELNFQLEPILVDPGGDDRNYPAMAADLIGRGVHHLVGCYTSSSRKEIAPLVESGDAVLWYPMHYEGFEIASNIVYTGAAPNHHVVPLVRYLVKTGARRVYCIGSDYIWAWENHRILAEVLRQNGGDVVGEQLLKVGNTGEDVDRAIAEILQLSPDIVFNNLIGDSSYAFYRRFRAACERAGIDQVQRFPVASCTLNEPELLAIGAGACDGHISSGVYFSSISGNANKEFIDRFRRNSIPHTQVCADAETSYIAMRLLAMSIAAAGTDEPSAVIASLRHMTLEAPQGNITVDPQILHLHATPRIGISEASFTFRLVFEASAPEPPDPYLVRTTPRNETIEPESLRVAS